MTINLFYKEDSKYFSILLKKKKTLIFIRVKNGIIIIIFLIKIINIYI